MNRKPKKTDPNAPENLEIEIRDKKTGNILFSGIVPEKHFKTGSVGYYLNGKMTNGAEKYQIGCSITLIGSKPE